LDAMILSAVRILPIDPARVAGRKFEGFYAVVVGVCLDCLERWRLLAGHGATFFLAAAQTVKTKAPYLLISIGMLGLVSPVISTVALASPRGDNCRKKICSSAVSACMRADHTLNPTAWTQALKKTYCVAFFNGCMTREITPDPPWYSPEIGCQVLAMSSIDGTSPSVTMRGQLGLRVDRSSAWPVVRQLPRFTVAGAHSGRSIRQVGVGPLAAVSGAVSGCLRPA
jgi:hypothetical protein